MHIERFSSTHFRNLTHDPVTFSPRVNLLVGHNGHGKTNILEAIQFFQFGRSFRSSRDGDLIRFGEDFCRVEVVARMASGIEDTLAVSIERRGSKRIKLGANEIPKYSEMIGHYPCVLFGPQDLALVSGFPAERRKFVDIVGSMTDRAYYDALKNYRRVLAQRNAALKARQIRDAQGVWTEELIARGCEVVERRMGVVGALREQMTPHIAAMQIRYPIDMVYESELLAGRPDEVTLAEQFAAKLAAIEHEETRRGVTLVGPHRDDIRILTDGKDVRRYGSQGQRRLMAVLLRLAELTFTEERLKEPCVLLLDDLFSELDPTVSKNLKTLLADARQIFVTSPVPLDWDDPAETRVYRVHEGALAATQNP